MNRQEYLRNRERISLEAQQYRACCYECFQPIIGCYCSQIERFDPKIEFVILIHPIEVKRRIATGRMSHLSLKNSHLFRGENFSKHEGLNIILEDPTRDVFMLYPGATSVNLSGLSAEERSKKFSSPKKLTVVVIDGTWATARKMVRSENLKNLNRICFVPSRPSSFIVRKQPRVDFFSTIEAIHETIELLGEARQFDRNSRRHDGLLNVFRTMVERQVAYVPSQHRHPRADTSSARG